MFRVLFNSAIVVGRSLRSIWLAVEASHQHIVPVALAVLAPGTAALVLKAAAWT